MKILKLKTPGKLNLRLDVLAKRADGYHELRMINSAISIYDDVELEVTDRGIEVFCENDPMVPSGENNLVFKATKEIMAYSNKNVGIRIRINKFIPSAAGMGGGSSNAAAVILGLNQLLKIQLPKEKLMTIGLRFGSDIPFFMYGSPAIATGIGENLTKIKKLPKMPMVIVTPNISVPTQSVYEKYHVNGKHNNMEELPQTFATKKTVIKYLNNDLEMVTAKQYPIVDEIKTLLMKHGALAAQMTGSGPTVFGIFADKEKAERTAKKLKQQEPSDWKVFHVENI